MAGVEPRAGSRRPLRRYAVSPRIADLDPDVADGFERALEALPGERVEPPPPHARLDVLSEYLDLVLTEMLVHHRRFDDRRDAYRPAIRARLEHAEQRAMTAEEYIGGQARRAEDTARVVRLARRAPDRCDRRADDADRRTGRGNGYDEAFGDLEDLSLTHYWDWTGFPVVALPSGVGERSGLPVGVSLIGAPGSDWDLLAAELHSRTSSGR